MSQFYRNHVHFFSCVVLFDANVSLYFVIGYSGSESKTQPRYISRKKAGAL